MKKNQDKIEIPGYRILRELGKGGMATVYLAVQMGFEREIALKVMSASLTDNEDYRKRFDREAKIVGQLSHPNIVPVYDMGHHNGHLYLAMELLKYGDLRQRIKRDLSPTEALAIAKQIAQALCFAHEKGFIHRDVKPENILFRDDNTAVLTDFGIARTQDASGAVTVAQSIIGTPRYMSPEQALGEPLDASTDIYSLGVVLYEMLTGERPSTGAISTAISVLLTSKDAPLLEDSLAIMQQLVNTLLAKSKADRFQHATDVCAAIDALQEEIAVGNMTLVLEKTEIQSTTKLLTNTSRKTFSASNRLWPQLLLSALILGFVGILTVNYTKVYNPTPRSDGASEIPVGLSNGSTTAVNPKFYISALGRYIEDTEELSAGEYEAIAWKSGYRAKEVKLVYPLAKYPEVELEPVASPTTKEFYAFIDALENEIPEIGRKFIKRFPNSPLGDILAVKVLNEDKHVSRLQLHAEIGEETALFALSELSDYGWGIKQDKEEAQKLAKQAAQHGYSLGEFQYGILLLANQPTGDEVQDAIRYLKRAAGNGYFLAQTRLGLVYLNGEHVKKNVDKGVDYLSRAAAQGDRLALYYLGRVYDAGIGLPADREKAKTYFRQAASLGHQGALAYLE